MDLRSRQRQIDSASVQVIVIGLLYATLALLPGAPGAEAYETGIGLAGAAAALLGLGVRRRIGWCLHLCVLLFTLSAIVLLHLTVTEYGWTRLLRLVLALWAQFLLFRAITSVQVLRNNP